MSLKRAVSDGGCQEKIQSKVAIFNLNAYPPPTAAAMRRSALRWRPSAETEASEPCNSLQLLFKQFNVVN